MLSLFNAAAPDGGGPDLSYGLRRARLDLILGDPQYSRWFASAYAGEGIRWRAMPADFPHWRTVYGALHGWQKAGATEAMHDELRRQCRIAAGRESGPTAAVIDSQSVKAAEQVAGSGRGYDAGKKVNGRKRHIVVDALGLLLTVLITAAGVQDRDAAKLLQWNLRKAFPTIRLAWADGGYAGKLVTWAGNALQLTLEIVRRPDDLHTFKVLPRRWVVERTLAWITRYRRTVRDYERPAEHHESIVNRDHDPPPRPAAANTPAARHLYLTGTWVTGRR